MKLPDRYEIKRTLGQGGFGTTYAAHDRETGRDVAVKVLDLRHAENWKAIELFEREARTLQALDHPQIPDYIEFRPLKSDDRALLVQELAPGKPLDAGPLHLDAPELVDIAEQVLEILVYLGDLSPPVVHRDIKPGNIVSADDGTLYLVDFGAVKDVARATIAGSETVAGTFGYMAPEQLHGEASPASDLYGLGMTLVHLATGRFPADLPRKRLKPDFRRYARGLPAGFAAVIERLVEPVPEDRFASAREALSALRSSSQAAPTTAKSELNSSLFELELLAASDLEVDPLEPLTSKKPNAQIAIVMAIMGLLMAGGIAAFSFLSAVGGDGPGGSDVTKTASLLPLSAACSLGDVDACRRGFRADGSREAMIATAERACANDVAQACWVLADAYDRGIGLPSDMLRAIPWYGESCALNVTNSCDRLEMLLNALGDAEREELNGRIEADWGARCRERVVERGRTSDEALWPCLWLARWISEGRAGRPASADEAMPYWEIGCEHGQDEWSCTHTGSGVP